MKNTSYTEENNKDKIIIRDFLQKDLESIECLLNEVTNRALNINQKISKQIISSGGKRLRPILTIIAGKIFNYNDEKLYYLATAIELIHTATLLHDDVIDDSDMRRSQKTANRIWDNKAPILVGDFLFAESFKMMTKSKSLDVLNLLAKVSSIIAEGEIKQLEMHKAYSLSKEEYFSVIKSKTAELFGAALNSAALLAGRSSSECSLLKDFGINLGIAFQIMDDLIDYVSETTISGKGEGDDFFEGKITLPLILLYEVANEDLKKKIIHLLNKKTPEEKDFQFIKQQLLSHNIINKCKDIASYHINLSQNILNSLPQNQYCKILSDICELSLERRS